MPRNRAWFFAGAAVVVPVAALCWMQYRSFGELESKTAAVVRDTLRRNLELVRRDLESRIEAIAADALSGIGPGAVDKLAAARARQPHVDRVFYVSHCSCARKPSAAVEPGGKAEEAEACALLEAFKAARPVGEFEYFQLQPRANAKCGSCHQKAWIEQRDSAVYVFRAVAGTEDFAGIRIRTDTIRQQLLPQSVAALRRGRAEPSWKAEFADTGAAGADQVAIHAGDVLPLWHLVGEYEGSNIHSLAKAQQRRSLWLSTFLLACLLAGIGFTMRAAAREAQLAELKSAFVSNISHEMKTPLAAISAFAETLQLGRVKDSARQQQYFSAIHDESRRLSELIDNVLDLSSVESARKQWQFELADPGRIVEAVYESSREQILAAGFHTSLRVDRPLAPVRADARALGTVLANLLSNAVKYSPDHRRIDVHVWQDAGHTHISVADQGIGIASADQHRIFEKFYRASDPLVHDVKGAGLGLALAREIVEAHHGTIQVASRPGHGSTFTVKLPAAAPHSTIEAPALGETAHR